MNLLAKEQEVGKIKKCHGKYQLEMGSVVVEIDPNYYRPTEVDILVGDSKKAQEKLGWQPKYDLDALIDDMMHNDIENV